MHLVEIEKKLRWEELNKKLLKIYILKHRIFGKYILRWDEQQI